MTLEETKRDYDRFVVPESRNIPRSSARDDGHVDFKKPHNPLLFIAGEKDHIIPSTLNKKKFWTIKTLAAKEISENFQTELIICAGRKTGKK